MATYNVDFEMQYRVEIENSEAVKAYFIDGDWKESFWELDDIEDFCRSLTTAFDRHPEYFDKELGGSSRFVEGFGLFNKPVRSNAYHLTERFTKDIGSRISVRVTDELEPVFVTEKK